MEEKRPLGAEIRLTSNAIKNYIDRYMNERFAIEITGVECMTLAYIFRHEGKPIVAADLMRRFGVSKATISQTLSGLSKKGFVRQKTSKVDGRIKIISLTKKGKDLKIRFDKLFKKINASIVDNFSEEEKTELYRLLKKIQSNVGYVEMNEDGRSNEKDD